MRKHVVSQVKIPSNRIEAKHADVDRERTHSSDAQAENDFAQADTPPQSRDRGDSHLRFRTLPAQSRSSISQPRSQDSAGASRRKENPQVCTIKCEVPPTQLNFDNRSTCPAYAPYTLQLDFQYPQGLLSVLRKLQRAIQNGRKGSFQGRPWRTERLNLP